MDYQAYKGRVIERGIPTEVYRNLHNGLLSVRQRGLVVAHVYTIDLSDVTFKVNESGRQRVLREKKKNVHAFVCGHVVGINAPSGANVQRYWRKVAYNPYKMSSFMSGSEIAQAGDKQVHCSATLGIFISKPNEKE